MHVEAGLKRVKEGKNSFLKNISKLENLEAFFGLKSPFLGQWPIYPLDGRQKAFPEGHRPFRWPW